MTPPVDSHAKEKPKNQTKILDRKLPQSLEAEQYVIGAMLLDETIVPDLLQLLSFTDYFSPRHQKIFQAIQHVYDNLATLDPVLVRDRLQKQGLEEEVGGMDYLEELMLTVSTVANADYHAKEVRDKAILRHLITSCTEVIQGAYESEDGAAQQLDKAEQMVMEISNSGRASDFIQVETVVDEIFKNFHEERSRGVMSGFHDLDNITTGLHPANLIIVAGRPSMGKTTFSMNIVENVARAGGAVAIFSLEVSKDMLIQNLLCSFSRVDAQRFRKNELVEQDWEKLVHGADQLRKLKIYVDDTSSLTPIGLRAKARRLHRKQKLDMIVIDYLQLMEGSGGQESRQQEISKISRSLKGLARELDVPVITLSQLSRGVENRESHRPRLSDLRESGAIEQDADLVMLLYREEYYKPDKEEAKGKGEVIIAKQRNGPTGSVELAFRNRFMKFENLAPDHMTEPEF